MDFRILGDSCKLKALLARKVDFKALRDEVGDDSIFVVSNDEASQSLLCTGFTFTPRTNSIY